MSASLLTNSVGNVRGSASYTPFGEVMGSTAGSASAGSAKRLGFAGEQTDATGLQYLRARYYAPEQGRFLTVDPYAGRQAIPYSLHPYQYGYSNPLRYVDPSGLCAEHGDEVCWGVYEQLVGKFPGIQDIVFPYGWDWTSLHELPEGELRYILDTLHENPELLLTAETILDLSISAGEFSDAAIDQWAYNNFGWMGLPEEVVSQWDEQPNESDARTAGRVAADVASICQGTAEIVGGIGAITGGGATCAVGAAPTAGGACVVGGAAAQAGAAAVAHGATTVVVSAGELAEDTISMMSGGEGGGFFNKAIRFRGLNRNRPVGELTHNQIYNTLTQQGLNPSSHFIQRLRQRGTTLRDLENHFNYGTLYDAGNGVHALVYGDTAVLFDADTGRLVNFRPFKPSWRLMD